MRTPQQPQTARAKGHGHDTIPTTHSSHNGDGPTMEPALMLPLMTLTTLSSPAMPTTGPGAIDSPPLPPAWSSSEENNGLRAQLAVDGDPSTRWSSSFNDNQWLVIDLGEPRTVRSLGVHWNTAAAKDYRVQASLDGATFTTIATRENDTPEELNTYDLDPPAQARFLRFLLGERTTGWGFSIHEVRVNGKSLAHEDLPAPPEDAVYRDPTASPAARARDAVSRMSFREKVRFLSGTEMFFFKGNERLGLDRLFFADASMGLRLENSTAFPAFVSLAASFDPDLAARYGSAVAEECRAKGVHVLLGPGVNLYRVAQGGRNFEYLGEDPYLASHLVVPYIRAVQDRGVMATVKHFAVNNHEWHRKASNSVVDERTLHEVYFPAFEASIKQADVGAVMTAYNLVNGEWAAQSPWLVQGVLRDRWNYDGLVMTDWWSIYDTLKTIKSGIDLEMPHGDLLNEPAIRDLVTAGLVSTTEIDAMVERSLRAFFKFGFYDRDQTDPEAVGFGGPHNEVALDVARAGMVLAKNENNFLPLDRAREQTVVLLGKNARATETSGYGAARVEPTDPVHILDAVRAAAGPRVTVRQFDDLTADARRAIEAADAVFVSVSTREREANDRPFELYDEQQALVDGALELSDKVGVIITAGSGIAMDPWIDDTRAVLWAWFGGNVGNTAVGEILFGTINPEGKMPFTLERRAEDAPAHGRFLPHDATFNDEPIWGKERPVFPVMYTEGLHIGYRHYDRTGVEPLFPFGHGLSYTSFEIEDLEVDVPFSAADAVALVRVRVTNTGARPGAEVAQLYIGQPEASVERPVRELKGFRKVHLDPGESVVVEFELTERDLSYYDTTTRSWQRDPAPYSVFVGNSSRSLPLEGEVTLPTR